MLLLSLYAWNGRHDILHHRRKPHPYLTQNPPGMPRVHVEEIYSIVRVEQADIRDVLVQSEGSYNTGQVIVLIDPSLKCVSYLIWNTMSLYAACNDCNNPCILILYCCTHVGIFPFSPSTSAHLLCIKFKIRLSGGNIHGRGNVPT